MNAKKETIKSDRRPPVVVVLGHVDHGKSSLLEAIRDFKITSQESGGITQHIGAYEVEEKEKKITFIDTPGHEAFSAMRARGAEVADIALLVVDAAQSVQPQTKEATLAVKRAGIPMIVVINKIDLPNANPEKIKGELSKIDILVESFGGNVPSVNVSAKEKKGIDELLDMILLVAEMRELKSEIDVPVEGLIIESYMDANIGPVATAIVKKGILKRKDIIATDLAIAKSIKSIKNSQGKEIFEGLPSQPVVILGFEKVPAVGEKFKTYKSIKEAEEEIKREEPKREIGSTVLDLSGDKKVLNIILKGDVFGSLEAIEAMLKALPQEKAVLRILKSEVGDINESDAKLAEMSKAIIIGFRVQISPTVMKFMKNPTSSGQAKARIKTFEVIYELIQDVRSGLEKTLEPEIVREDIGKLRTILVFWGEKNRQIVGGKITEGELKKGLKLEVLRQDRKVGTGRIVNLQRDKKDVDLARKGDEAGILFEGNIKIEKGDIIVAFVETRQKSEL